MKRRDAEQRDHSGGQQEGKPQRHRADGSYPVRDDSDYLLVQYITELVVDDSPAAVETFYPETVSLDSTGGIDHGSIQLLPCIDVLLEGGIKATAWLDTLSSACILNPDILKLSPTTVVKHASGFIGGANKEHTSLIIGVVGKLLIRNCGGSTSDFI